MIRDLWKSKLLEMNFLRINTSLVLTTWKIDLEQRVDIGLIRKSCKNCFIAEFI